MRPALRVAPLAAQGSRTGDVFGDLIHILRAPATGQPVLAQRWVELPGPVTGYGWGYCPIAVDASGGELAFIPYTCDPLDLTAVQEVDYFGRLNASRTSERNIRMHFDEVIATIKLADWVDSSGCGRLRLYLRLHRPGRPGDLPRLEADRLAAREPRTVHAPRQVRPPADRPGGDRYRFAWRSDASRSSTTPR